MPDKLPSDTIVSGRVAAIEDYVRQYNDGCITSHELARAVATAVLTIQSFPEQGCDGLASPELPA